MAPQRPTITAVVGAYNAERYIGETVASIVAQTLAPDEIIVVDDGSTDSTVRELERFGSRVRIVKQRNGGCPAAFNRAFAEATCDYVAMCGADDLWEPTKLERQAAALAAHPEIDLAFAGSWSFGEVESPWPDPPGEGILDRDLFLRVLFREDIVCASSIVIRRSLFQRLGPFLEQVGGERFACDDYEYWLRALAHGAVFYYEPGIHARYRRHPGNATKNQPWVCRSRTATHQIHAGVIDDPRFVAEILASDLRLQARAEVTEGEMHRARTTFARSLRHERNLRASTFILLLSLPESWSRRLIARWVQIRPTLLRLTGRDRRGLVEASVRPTA
jgi:glycosyltransferase involved in cell wall biosynthesis